MKYLVQIEIYDEHPILHRQHVDGEDTIKETIMDRLTVLEGAKINVKKVAAKKKK